MPPVAPSASEAAPLVGMPDADLRQVLSDAGVADRQHRMRMAQLRRWLYVHGATDFSEMTDVAKGLRAVLSERLSLARPEIVDEQVSRDGTRKWLLRLAPDARTLRAPEVEAVYIPETDRGTLCISSQVGCTLTCTFCHTGTQKLVRNLTAGEIVGQIMVARDRLGDFPGRERAQRMAWSQRQSEPSPTSC